MSIDEDVLACAPQDRLQQVFINLVENAIKYSALEQLVELVLGNREQQVIIHLGDRGIGISLPHQNRILSDFTGWLSQERPLETVQGWDWRSPKASSKAWKDVLRSDLNREKVVFLLSPYLSGIRSYSLSHSPSRR